MPSRLVQAVVCAALWIGGWNESGLAEPPSLGGLFPPAEPTPSAVKDAPGGPTTANAPAADALPPETATKPEAVPPSKPAPAVPYRATIVTEAAAVRSGPGEEFYETSRLRRGDELEVYRHDPHGWCAVRPPAGSVSYVPAEHLKILEDDVAETTVAGVKSFIGSSVGDGRDRSQVSLRRGERVVLLEKKPAEGLCKIAPPAGEFRWVHESCLERLGPVSESSRSAGNSSEASGAASLAADQWRAAPRTTAFGETDDASGADGGAKSGLPHGNVRGADGTGRPLAGSEGRLAPRKPRRALPPQRGWVRPSSASTEEEESGEDSASASPLAPLASQSLDTHTPKATAPAPRGDPLLAEALDQLDLALSSMVCQPKNQWKLEPLRDAAKEALRSAASPSEQGRARALLDRLAQFEKVRRQSLGLPSLDIETQPGVAVTAPAAADVQRPGVETASRVAAAPPKPSASGTAAASPPPTAVTANSPLPPNWEDPRFDGTGRLVPLEKRGDSDPQFLLVDDQGVARYFVTPAPGVNLRSYRDRIVGVTGSRSADPDGGKPHLTAQRVTLLPDGPMRR